jgi:LPS sulfotransferase NodH
MNSHTINKFWILAKDLFGVVNIHRFIGDRQYGKFVIITRSRSGSSLLMGLLNSHPDVLAKGEMYRRLYGRNSGKLWNRIFSKKNKKISQVGFKIFYYHPLDSKDRSVWDFIKSDSNIRIIHLTRRDKLKTYLSKVIALKTDEWYNKKKKSKLSLEKRKVNLNPSDFIRECETIKSWEKSVATTFASHRVINVYYEDLVSDNSRVMSNIFRFLDISQVEVKPSYTKQNTESIDQLVLNYEEFSEVVRKTEWGYLLKT